MRISFLINSLMGGGAERMVSRLANEMSKQGHEVSVLLFSTKGAVYELSPEVKQIECAVAQEINTRSLQGIYARITAIRKALQQEKTDVLFAFMIPMVPFALLAAVGTGIKVIGAERANPKALSKIYRVLIKTVTPFCSGYVFQTEGARELYPRGIAKKSVVIGNIAPKCEATDRFVETEKLKLCAAGSLNRFKDFPTVLAAIKQVKVRIPDVDLTIYGDGPMREELEQYLRENALTENVHFVGFSKNLLKDFQKYDLFLFSSRSEGMPNVLLEAMSVGLECIATDCDFGPRELIQNGVNGWLVPVGDSAAMAEKIVACLENKDRHEQICQNARKVQKDYSVGMIVEKYLSYAERILQDI